MAGQYCEILTGRFQTGTEEQKTVIRSILGENTADAYELYFHWYNILHEFAHIVAQFNADKRLSDTGEELYANDFAVAYWARYGEEEKFKQLRALVTHALGRFVTPVPEGRDYLEFFQEHWQDGTLYNFNDFGWFQFTCVDGSIHRDEPLESVMRRRLGPRKECARGRIAYDLYDTGTAQRIVDDAREIMLGMGLRVPPVFVKYIDNPEDHRLKIVTPEV